MSLTRASLIGGAAHLTFNGYSTQLADDGTFDVEPVWKEIISGMYDKIDDVEEDLIIRIAGTPLTYDPSTTPAALYPYLTPMRGTFYPGATDLPLVMPSNNGDIYTAVSAVLTKMSDITLGASGPFFSSKSEWAGIIGNGLDPEATSSYYTLSTGSYTGLAIDKTKIPRGKYSFVWGTNAGFYTTPFEFEDPPVISFDLKLEAIRPQGRTRAFRLIRSLAMLKGKPNGPTAAQILAAAKFTGASGATHGHLMSINAADLVGTGPAAVTLKNAAMVKTGFVFGNKALRNGEVGFVTCLDTSGTSAGPILTLA